MPVDRDPASAVADAPLGRQILEGGKDFGKKHTHRRINVETLGNEPKK
jgi:hypothetical protein